MSSKILVILSCSKKKLDIPAPADQLYQGDLFKNAQKWIKIHNYNFVIISAKYGFVFPKKILRPYEKMIKNLYDIMQVRKKVLPKLRKELSKYELIILIIGNNYIKIIEPLISEFNKLSFYRLQSKNGYFDYKRNIRKLLNNNLRVLKHYSGPKINLNKLIL